MKRFAKPILAVAAASIGALSGYLTAGTSLNPNVVAAVVTALLAGLIGWVALTIRKETFEQSLVPSLFSVIFCVSFWLVLEIEVKLQELRAAEALGAELEMHSIILRERFANCSEIEFRTNLARKAVGLGPLRNGIVCEAMTR